MNSDKKYQFHVTKDIFNFRANTDCGTLQTYHFCYQCIVCNIDEFTLQRTKFCLFGTVPRTFVYDKSMYIVFYVTYLLEACLETVRRQILNMPEIQEYEHYLLKKEFQFSDPATQLEIFKGEAEIKIEIPKQKDLPNGWQFGQQPRNKVHLLSSSTCIGIGSQINPELLSYPTLYSALASINTNKSLTANS